METGAGSHRYTDDTLDHIVGDVDARLTTLEGGSGQSSGSGASISQWQTVTPYDDGQSLTAEVLNKPVSQLTGRTDYLKSRMDRLVGNGAFSSVRFDVSLSDTDTPSRGDVVCLDMSTGKYVKAVATMSAFDPYSPAASCRVVGVLTDVTGASSGVVTVSGFVDLSGGGSSPMDMSSMMEDGGRFCSGLYYLSSTVPGKITMNPRGPAVQVGEFVANGAESSRTNGDFAIVRPQFGSLLEHRHETFPLAARPAGGQLLRQSTDTVEVIGYAPDSVRSGSVSGRSLPLLRLSGSWPNRADASYSMWLSTSSGSTWQSSPEPDRNFGNTYLYWKSDMDPEHTGSVRIPGFHDSAAVGSLGLVVSVEPAPGHSDMSSLLPSSDSDAWDVDSRTWTVRMPSYAMGWAQNTVHARSDLDSGTLHAFGTPNSPAREIHVFFPSAAYVLGDQEVQVGSSIRLSSGSDEVVYRFVDGETDPSEYPGETVVPIAGDAFYTYCSIVRAFSEDGVPHAVVSDTGTRSVTIGLGDGVSAEFDGVSATLVGAESGSTLFLAYDPEAESVVSSGHGSIASPGRQVELSDGMSLYATAPSGGSLSFGNGDHILEIGVGVHSAKFRYAIEMDGRLSSAYPPVPASSASLMWNGVELESGDLFGERAVYDVGPDSLYWHDDGSGRVPWPSSYEDPEIPVQPRYEHRLVLHMLSSFNSATGPVTSLRPAEGAPVRITRCGTGDSDTVGDLEIDVDMTASVEDGSAVGYKAVKCHRNGRLLLGPVVERIVAGPGIEVTQGGGQPSGQGTVTVSLSGMSYSGYFDTVALENAKEEMVGMFPYTRLLGWSSSSASNVKSGFVAKFQVPHNVNPGMYRVRVYATVFGEEGFSSSSAQKFAGLSMEYSVLPEFGDPGSRLSSSQLTTPMSMDSPRAVDVPFGTPSSSGTYSYKAFDTVLAHNDSSMADDPGRSQRSLGEAFPVESECTRWLSVTDVGGLDALCVKPGYIVAVRFSRAAATKGQEYTGRIGFIGLRWSLVEVGDDSAASEDGSAKKSADDVVARLVDVAGSIGRSTTTTVNEIRAALLRLVDELRY